MAHAGYLPGPERRRQILAGAKRVFARRGYHDTNISHICDDLGIGRGTLYQYFASKRDVFAAIADRRPMRYQHVCVEAITCTLPPHVITSEEIEARLRPVYERLGLPEPQSAIVPVILQDSERAMAASRRIEDAGFLITAIRPPTVPEGTARLRITFTAAHTDEMVSALADAIAVACPPSL